MYLVQVLINTYWSDLIWYGLPRWTWKHITSSLVTFGRVKCIVFVSFGNFSFSVNDNFGQLFSPITFPGDYLGSKGGRNYNQGKTIISVSIIFRKQTKEKIRHFDFWTHIWKTKSSGAIIFGGRYPHCPPRCQKFDFRFFSSCFLVN